MPRRRPPIAPASTATAGKLVQFAPPDLGLADYDALADTMLAVAAEVTAAEDLIKRRALAAADAGDAAGAARILRRWFAEPATDLAASLSEEEVRRCG